MKTVLITGCSEGGLGSALAIAFHDAGLYVYATARNLSKMKHLEALGIETLTLDVLSETSIAECVAKVPSLDILVNNAGALYNIPVADIDLSRAKELFELNVWSYIAMTQAFLPLLLKSNGMIVNQTSVASIMTLPFQSVYHASKAAVASFSDHLRLELLPFNVRVVDLKTGTVKSNIFPNHTASTGHRLPQTSLFALHPEVKEVVEESMRGHKYAKNGVEQGPWAEAVVRDLLKENPPGRVWRGYGAWGAWLSTFLPLPYWALDGLLGRLTGLDVVARMAGT